MALVSSYIPLNVHVKYLLCMVCMPMGIFVSRKICGSNSEVEVAVSCVLAYIYIYKNVGSISTYSVLTMCAIFGMWQQYLFCDIYQIYVKCSLLKG